MFFAAELAAAWHSHFPPGRIVAEEFRHLTIAFLGMTDREAILKQIDQIPRPSWHIGPSGLLQKWIFLPTFSPRVVAAEASFFQEKEAFFEYQKNLSEQFKTLKKELLPHATVARAPFDTAAWSHFPCQIPFFIRGIALWKSLGHSTYAPIWTDPSISPFEEIEHTADLAYTIRGQNFSQLAYHALLALSFSFPAFRSYLDKLSPCNSFEEIVHLLNQWIAEIDMREGIGLKAVSYHANIAAKENHLLEWTMIVDV